MKKIFVYMLLISISSNVFAETNDNKAVSSFPYNDTTVLRQILALPLNNYIGKPADSILQALPGTYTERGFIPVGIGYAKGIFQAYGTQADNSCFVEIFIDTFRYMSFPNRTSTSSWDMGSAKKETVSFYKNMEE